MKRYAIALLASLGSIILSAQLSLAEQPWDPFEPMNRGIFWFNDKADTYVLEPVARGYDYVMPEFGQRRVSNFFSNLKSPVYLVSDLIDLNFDRAAVDTGRFLINSTIGLGGLFDVATEWGLEKKETDIGIALAKYCVPAGPYIVLPFLGPSNLRDGFGLASQTFMDPVFYLRYAKSNETTRLYIPAGLKGLQFINTRADLLEAIKSAKESSVDYYLFMQSAYYQYRRGLQYDGNPPDEEEVIEDQ